MRARCVFSPKRVICCCRNERAQFCVVQSDLRQGTPVRSRSRARPRSPASSPPASALRTLSLQQYKVGQHHVFGPCEKVLWPQELVTSTRAFLLHHPDRVFFPRRSCGEHLWLSQATCGLYKSRCLGRNQLKTCSRFGGLESMGLGGTRLSELTNNREQREHVIGGSLFLPELRRSEHIMGTAVLL